MNNYFTIFNTGKQYEICLNYDFFKLAVVQGLMKLFNKIKKATLIFINLY